MSSRYLLDTCILSEFAKPRPEPKVIEWLNSIDLEDAYLCAVTIGEVQLGINNLPSSNRRADLEIWLNSAVSQQFAGRILTLDVDTFIVWGQLTSRLRRNGEPMAVMDSLIAASALQHKMVLVTRNISDFKSTGLAILNPWE